MATLLISCVDKERGRKWEARAEIEYRSEAVRTYRRIVALVFAVLGIEMEEEPVA